MDLRIAVGSVVIITMLFSATSLMADDLELVQERPKPEDFSLVDLNGKNHQLSDYLGSVVLVSFWATWCPQCVWEMPLLQSLAKDLGNARFILLAVNVGEQRQRVRNFVDRYSIEFPVLLDTDLATYTKWPVLGLPTSLVIDREGRIVYKAVGAIEWMDPDNLSKIESLLTSNISQ